MSSLEYQSDSRKSTPITYYCAGKLSLDHPRDFAIVEYKSRVIVQEVHMPYGASGDQFVIDFQQFQPKTGQVRAVFESPYRWKREYQFDH